MVLKYAAYPMIMEQLQLLLYDENLHLGNTVCTLVHTLILHMRVCMVTDFKLEHNTVCKFGTGVVKSNTHYAIRLYKVTI